MASEQSERARKGLLDTISALRQGALRDKAGAAAVNEIRGALQAMLATDAIEPRCGWLDRPLSEVGIAAPTRHEAYAQIVDSFKTKALRKGLRELFDFHDWDERPSDDLQFRMAVLLGDAKGGPNGG